MHVRHVYQNVYRGGRRSGYSSSQLSLFYEKTLSNLPCCMSSVSLSISVPPFQKILPLEAVRMPVIRRDMLRLLYSTGN